MKIALLFVWLVNGSAHAILVERDLCLMTVESVRNGQRTTLEDERGQLFDIEKAQCVEDYVTAERPMS